MCFVVNSTRRRVFVFAATLIYLQATAVSDDKQVSPLDVPDAHFDSTVAPILARHCVECHNSSEPSGELNLVTGDGRSRVLDTDDPLDGELWHAVSTNEMPQDRPALTPPEKHQIRAWLLRGGRWGTQPLDPFLVTTDRRAGRDWWSLQPVHSPAVPLVQHTKWPRNEVDRFVLARLESRGWLPTGELNRRHLLRRLTFDLTGLPPTADEIAAFEADKSPDAYEKRVDELLARPQFGERWARRWLDVVRFGESQGMERNWVRDNAWRYRDWVIEAYNDDLPYDEFVRQQLAGDVLYPDQLDPLLATGFYVCGTWDMVGLTIGSDAMKRVVWETQLEELVATTGQALLGLTINCARCHDHKFDPITQTEYYQFAALLGGVNQAPDERSGIAQPPERKHAPFDGRAHVIIAREPPVFHVLDRGMVTRPGEPVTPTALAAPVGLDGDLRLGQTSPESERRLRLARWVTDPHNPLVARVYVNRIWQALFGDGLVQTPSDFGFQAGQPSHPDLLDWLAYQFVQDDWSTKRLIRRLALSATYRQDSVAISGTDAMRQDADARLRWRMKMRRLEGEELRDAMLCMSGVLDPRMRGRSFRDVTMTKGRNGNHEFTIPNDLFDAEHRRRTIYRLWARTGNHPLLESFDCPDPSVSAPRRNQTVTPLQALALMNNPFGDYCAKELASQIGEADTRDQVQHAYHRILLRPPTDQEHELGAEFVEGESLSQLCLVLFNSNEFVFLR
ncbi:MAG: DUF1553 domain-containing protein [Planctomycetales bacterium]|nr:DUF1553 domain-containing protein [Planctomycetales bacterium]